VRRDCSGYSRYCSGYSRYGVTAGTPFPYVIMQRHLLMRNTMPTFLEWYVGSTYGEL
jgi:hypothetical protein